MVLFKHTINTAVPNEYHTSTRTLGIHVYVVHSKSNETVFAKKMHNI